MTYAYKRALERIIKITTGTESQIDRAVRIYDIALEGLGLGEDERAAIVTPYREKLIQDRRDRIQARRDAEAALQEAAAA